MANEQNIQTTLTMNLVEYSLKDGLDLATRMLKVGYLSEVSGVRQHYFTMVLNGYQFGTVKRMPQRYIDQLNETFRAIGTELMATRITQDDTLSQVKAIGKKVSLPYIFLERMGWTKAKTYGRISKKQNFTYGKFDPEHITEINQILLQIGMTLLTMHMSDAQQETTT